MEPTYENVIGRSEILLEVSNTLSGILRSEKILLTGAGGSIGSRLALEISKFPELSLIATDRDENSLHSLSLQIMGTALFNSSQFRVLDVRDEIGVDNIIREYKPTMIIHAAALKHLAILERKPREAFLTNVLGTKNLLDSATRYGVQRFLNISTDKAASPTSILGKTKYLAEILTVSKRRNGFSQYTNVRFGNVFNSKGSVIETFSQQINLGLPITLTDPSVQRYFMKIEEAASLSLMAAALNAGDVHILEMGVPVKIMDVIIRLQTILNGNSVIEIVGLRKGEKLTEELWSPDEKIVNTENPRIKALNLSVKEDFVFPQLIDVSSDNEAITMIQKALSEIHATF